jgi:hypothetical protein
MEQAWHARIDFDDGLGGGSGFLITPRHVLTCAHVVANRQAAVVCFPRPEADEVSAAVTLVGPWQRDDDTGAGDVAVLELATPVSTAPAVFAPFTVMDTHSDAPFFACGHPPRRKSGVITRLRADTSVLFGGEACQVGRWDDTGQPLDRGFSGSAVFRDGTGEVIGMITHVDSQGLGRMLTVEAICRHVPHLSERISLGPFSATAYRELRDLLSGLPLPPRVAAQLHQQVMQGRGPDQPAKLSSVLSVAEWLATETTFGDEKVKGLMVELLLEVARREASIKERLREWFMRYAWSGGEAQPSPEPRAEPAVPGLASVIVRLAPSAEPSDAGDVYRLTIWTLIGCDGDAGVQLTDERVQRREIQDAVERWLPVAISRIPGQLDVVIEFVLPRNWLSMPVDEWRALDDDDVPLGWSKPVVVRDLSRFNERVPRELERRADELRADPDDLSATLQWKDCRHPQGPAESFRAWLRGPNKPLAVGLAGVWSSSAMVTSAVGGGVPILLWPRTTCDGHPAGGPETGQQCLAIQFSTAVTHRLRGVRMDALPAQVHELRTEAAQSPADQPHCGRGISLLWDDPRRRPPHVLLGLSA